jgi:hypothetical protein
MIELLLRAIEKGVELAREGEKNRARFFQSAVVPIDDLFVRLYSEHLATFRDLRAAIERGANQSELGRILESNALNEGGTAELLLEITDPKFHHRSPVRGSLQESFDRYINLVSDCLLEPSPKHPFRVGAYRAAAAYIQLDRMTARPMTREQLHAVLDSAIMDMNAWYARVRAAFEKLRIECAR